MSSEAAQKAYPAVDVDSIELSELAQEAFDKGAQWGAVEALRQAAAIAERYAAHGKKLRDGSDYPDSRIGAEYHGLYHGANDVAVAIGRLMEKWQTGR